VGYYMVCLRSIAGLSARDLIPVSTLGTTFGVAALAALPLLGIRELAMPPSVRLVVGALAFAILAPLALRATRRISDDDLVRLRGVVTLRYGRAPHRA
jgi:hypothetical protein